MKLQIIDVDGAIFKVQKNMSFMQRNKVTGILESYMDLKKVVELQEQLKDIPPEELKGEMFISAIKEDKSITAMNTDLSTYLLKNVVHDPKITDEMLNDPDDPNTENYFVLGQELARLALDNINQMVNLKKTQIKS